jgi:hypothetical protein
MCDLKAKRSAIPRQTVPDTMINVSFAVETSCRGNVPVHHAPSKKGLQLLQSS